MAAPIKDPRPAEPARHDAPLIRGAIDEDAEVGLPRQAPPWQAAEATGLVG
jgi:hypothetical protein